MKTYLYPYNGGSESAQLLASEMGIKRIRRDRSKYQGQKNHTVINWGCAALPPMVAKAGRIINKPEACEKATNKLSFFKLIRGFNAAKAEWGIEDEGVSIPAFTESKKEASHWLREGKTIVCRKTLRDHGGGGIVLCVPGDPEENLVDAPLYVQYVPKVREYRVHVINGKAIRIQRKVAKEGAEIKCWQIRNHENGFIFQLGFDGDPEELVEVQYQAINATSAAKLDFAGVDVIWNQKEGKAYVLEVNTAPGIEGGTVTEYAKALKEMIGEVQ